MRGKRTTSLIVTYLLVQCLLCLTFLAKAQKNGFRGGAKSYEIHVEANTMGTNLHYELPESKVKAASKQDWLVDNDNAEMLAINSPVLARVNVKHPKFSMKGEWPGYKTSFKLPEDVSVASKRHDFYKSKHSKHLKIQPKTEQFNRNISSAEQASKKQTTPHKGLINSRIAGSKVAVRQIFKRKPGRKLRQEEGSPEMLKISRILLPIAGLKNVDLKNPHISKAMKGVVSHARKVVDEAKMVLSDAASFITKVRKLVKVTKDHSKHSKKEAKASAVAEEMEKTSSEILVENAAKHLASVLSQNKNRNKNGKINGAKMHDNVKNQKSLQIRLVAQKNTDGKERHDMEEKRREEQDTISGKGVSKRSYRDPAVETGNAQQNEQEPRVKRRGLPDTLESILYTINGLKKLFKYH